MALVRELAGARQPWRGGGVGGVEVRWVDSGPLLLYIRYETVSYYNAEGGWYDYR